MIYLIHLILMIQEIRAILIIKKIKVQAMGKGGK